MYSNKLKFRSLFLAFVVCSAILVLPFGGFAEVLVGEAYQKALCRYFARAEKSITVAMYFIILEPEGEGVINELVDGLIDAKGRGVEVKVILEDSKLKENRFAYKKLRDSGVNVYFDTPKHLLHIKGVVVDGQYVFLGSANWSRAAIEKNYEATNFTDSAQDALTFKQYVDNIPIQDTDIFLPITSGVSLSQDFLLLPKLGPRLLKSQAYKQLDLYLLLCKTIQEKGTNSLIIDYDSLAKKMGYVALQEFGKYRNLHNYHYERIHRSLVRLKRYGLIDYKKGKVTLKSSKSASIIVPYQYWQYNYPNKLSMRAKYMYLICLYEAARSTKYPFWFRSQKDMSKLYGISDTTISLGSQELEKKGIIEITRDKLNPNDFSDRKANVYKMLPLPGNQDTNQGYTK